jgi:hypothetical protein
VNLIPICTAGFRYLAIAHEPALARSLLYDRHRSIEVQAFPDTLSMFRKRAKISVVALPLSAIVRDQVFQLFGGKFIDIIRHETALPSNGHRGEAPL